MDGVNNKRMGSRRKELQAPCMKCETEHPGERHPGRHDHCGRYKEFKEMREVLRNYEKQNESAGAVYDPLAPVRRRFQ